MSPPQSQTETEAVNHLFPSFSSLSEEDAKTVSNALHSIVQARDETKRVHAEMPSLANKLRAVAFVKDHHADVSLSEFWTNRGEKYRVEFEIGCEPPKMLSMKFTVWMQEVHDLSGLKHEERVHISASYPGPNEELTAKLHFGSFYDPGHGWLKYWSHGMRDVFKAVAVDLSRVQASEDAGGFSEEMIGDLMSALISKEVAKTKILGRAITVLDVMTKDLNVKNEIKVRHNEPERDDPKWTPIVAVRVSRVPILFFDS